MLKLMLKMQDKDTSSTFKIVFRRCFLEDTCSVFRYILLLVPVV